MPELGHAWPRADGCSRGRVPPLTTAQVPCECLQQLHPQSVLLKSLMRMEDNSCSSAVNYPETASITAEWSRSTPATRRLTASCAISASAARRSNSRIRPSCPTGSISKSSAGGSPVWPASSGATANTAGLVFSECARDERRRSAGLGAQAPRQRTCQPAAEVAPRSDSVRALGRMSTVEGEDAPSSPPPDRRKSGDAGCVRYCWR